MRLFTIISFACLLALSSCGVSGEKKKFMHSYAVNAIGRLDTYIRDVTLSNIKRGTIPSTNAYYVADFECKFERWLGDGTKTELYGQIGFNKDGSLASVLMEEEKQPIILTAVIINGDSVPVDESEYNSYRFLSSNVKVAKLPSPDNTKEKQSQAVSQLKEWGAKDAYVSEDKYLVYVADESTITTTPAEAARLWDEMFSDVPGIVGFRIVSSSTKKTIGEYTR